MAEIERSSFKHGSGWRLLAILSIVLALTGLVWAGCGKEDVGGPNPGTAPPLVEISTRWATVNASDLSQLVESHPNVFVGNVQRLLGQRLENIFPITSSRAENQGHPLGAGSDSPLIPVSLYEVRVEKVLLSDLAEGETVLIQQAGGTIRSAGGHEVRVVLELDEPLE